MMKKRIIFALFIAIFACIALTISASAAQKYDFPEGAADVNVTLNSRSVLEDEAAIIDSVTYVPLRSFSELCGAGQREAASSVLLSTIFSILTLPIMVLMLPLF